MSNKFEQLLDYLVNEEHDKANELFHEIVVEKSRQIYDSMIAEEADAEEDEEVDEAREEEDDEEVDESFGDDEESMYEIGGDSSDDFVSDVESDDSEFDSTDGTEFGGEEGGTEPATKDDVLDIKDALEELKAEFEALLAAESNEEEEEPGIHGDPSPLDDLDDEEDDSEDEFGDEEEDDGEDDEAYEAFVREYREIVGKPYSGGKVAGTSEDSGTNTKSIVSSAKGRPNTDAKANNIAQSAKGEDRKAGADGKSLAGNIKGEFTKGVEKNISNKASSNIKNGAGLSKVAAGHGAEKKGSGESNSNTKDVLPN